MVIHFHFPTKRIAQQQLETLFCTAWFLLYVTMVVDCSGVQVLVRSSTHSSVGLSSFHRLLGEKQSASTPHSNMGSSDAMEQQVCSLFASMEDVVSSLFSSPRVSCQSDSSEDQENEKQLTTPPKSTPAPELKRPPMTPKEVCKLWKTKRRELKRETTELRQRASDFELQSATNQHAQQIQRTYERKFDDEDYSQRYEKYGSRASFLTDRSL